MRNIPSRYDHYRDREHIFIFGIGGRSSSTAIQRMLNSSNEVCIFGEPKKLIDRMLSLYSFVKSNQLAHDPIRQRDLQLLRESFQNNRHEVFYPNAFRSPSRLLEFIPDFLCELFEPINDVTRFGYKLIRWERYEYLETLRELFPHAHFVFLFRDPYSQWRSIKNFGKLLEAQDIQLFIKLYSTLSCFVTKFAKTHPSSIVVESNDLYHRERFEKILQRLHISGIDDRLYGKVVSSHQKTEISPDDRDAILKSDVPSWHEKLSALREAMLRDFALPTDTIDARPGIHPDGLR